MDVWYQVEKRKPAKIKEFSGRDVDDLTADIQKKELLEATPTSTWNLYVKPQEADEIELTEKFLIDSDGFGNLIKQYCIDSENPILVRLPDVFKSILKNGLPPLGAEIGLRSESSKNEIHEEATNEVSKFELIDDLSLDETISATWVTFENAGDFNYASEATIAKYVSLVMNDVIHAIGQKGKISLVEEMQFRKQRPDVWIIYSNGLPVGFIEVKKPSGKIMGAPLLAGQVYDYLYLLKSFYGIEWQFAIVSTYKEWRFFWLPGISDNIAKLKSVNDPVPSPIVQQSIVRQLPSIPRWDKKHLTTIRKVTQASQGQVISPRKVYSSKIISWASQELPIAIASMLHKMAKSPRHKVDLLDPNRAYVQMTENTWRWAELPSTLQEVKFGPSVRKDAKNFICLAYLGSGAEGLVWLTTTESGTGCVIKLASAIKPIQKLEENPFDEEMLEKIRDEEAERKKAFDHLVHEAAAWGTIWGIEARAQLVGGQPALIMPYFQMCSREELQANVEYRNAAKDALLLMAQKGYKHGDLSPRHVGFYKKTEQKHLHLHAVFIDLSHVHRVRKGDEEAIKEMMERLHLVDA
ncbi:hypothetical protein BC936DRAFT_149239 [Jimgerdemannia flammicorona]|uniref:DUF5898 domain-containing protein n=1 Tax=Jimgerdemannia flammicorona TaxID=994334 RepID=A0A433DKD3_9FUNG|nr:hypothetical protein BC936DRAFT_149239 [Jimgerdemannia flammicorona]